METVLTGFVILFLVLFSALTLVQGVVTTQDTLQVSWQEMQARVDTQSRTSLTVLDSVVRDSGTLVEVTLRNDGTTRLTNYNRWDAMVSYPDDQEPSNFHVEWLPYTSGALVDNRWKVAGLYLDSARSIPEAFEPLIFNSGEEMIGQLRLFPALAEGSAVQVVLSTDTGVAVSLFARRNVPPVLTVNTELKLGSFDTAPITQVQLLTTDADNSAEELRYVVTTAPSNGSLSLGATFTQDEINRGLLNYANSDGESDTFQFTVTDGLDIIGTYTFTITVNDPPDLVANGTLLVSGTDPVMIDSTLLETTDPDPSDDATVLTYTVVTSPSEGTLSLGSSFTQDDIDNGLLTYTQTGSGSDTFRFTVTDGEHVIGAYTFHISA